MKMGELIRKEIKNETKIGKLCIKYMDSGQLIPESILELLKLKEIAKQNIIKFEKKFNYENNIRD